MLLSSLGSSDSRFKSLEFTSGLNILVADRTESSAQGDSRNSVGKTSFIKILRYVMGGDLPPEFKTPELAGHSFYVRLSLPSPDGADEEEVTVTRPVSPTTRVQISGWSVVTERQPIPVEEWRLFPVEGVSEVVWSFGASVIGRGRGLPKMEVPTPDIWKTPTCLTLSCRPALVVLI
jgi:hypothetical protein